MATVPNPTNPRPTLPLAPSLPPGTPSQGRFENLLELDLSNNRIEGRLPATLSYATNLRKLNIANNYMVGPLVEGLGYLPNLEYFDFSYNLFSGDVPDSYVDQRESGCVVIGNGYKENFITRR